ncbi:MAG: DUF302 domain-containing protein [Acidobacteria bacterium]|nr:DUF302 domain-containing protein [Acidobacteriota bacterium]
MSAALIVVEGSRSVSATVTALRGALADRGIELFAVIDHAAGAASAGLELDDEVVVIFGDPAVGTRVMQADPRAGLDLPLRMLVWRQDSATRIAFTDPHALAERYDVPPDSPALEGMTRLLGDLAAQISGRPIGPAGA